MEFNGTFLATIITFVVFVFIMNKILYAPILGIMEERQSFIDSNYKEAQDNDKKSEELQNEHDERLDEAKDEARQKYIESVDGYKKQRTDIVFQAQNDASEELNREYDNLENISNEAKERLKTHMTDLANDIVEKVLGYRSEIHAIDNEAVDKILYQEKG